MDGAELSGCGTSSCCYDDKTSQSTACGTLSRAENSLFRRVWLSHNWGGGCLILHRKMHGTHARTIRRVHCWYGRHCGVCFVSCVGL